MVGLFASDTLAAFSFYFSEQNISVFRPMRPISTFSMQNLSQPVEDFIWFEVKLCYKFSDRKTSNTQKNNFFIRKNFQKIQINFDGSVSYQDLAT